MTTDLPFFGTGGCPSDLRSLWPNAWQHRARWQRGRYATPATASHWLEGDSCGTREPYKPRRWREWDSLAKGGWYRSQRRYMPRAGGCDKYGGTKPNDTKYADSRAGAASCSM